VAIEISAAKKRGVQPVIYGHSGGRDCLPEQDRYRFHPMGKRYDWTQEREWRSRKSITMRTFDPEDVRIFALDGNVARTALSDCEWQVTFLTAADRDTPSIDLTKSRNRL
jgi:hypothetical protein